MELSALRGLGSVHRLVTDCILLPHPLSVNSALLLFIGSWLFKDDRKKHHCTATWLKPTIVRYEQKHPRAVFHKDGDWIKIGRMRLYPLLFLLGSLERAATQLPEWIGEGEGSGKTLNNSNIQYIYFTLCSDLMSHSVEGTLLMDLLFNTILSLLIQSQFRVCMEAIQLSCLDSVHFLHSFTFLPSCLHFLQVRRQLVFREERK